MITDDRIAKAQEELRKKRREPRKLPETVQQWKDEAVFLLGKANNAEKLWDNRAEAERFMRMARRAVETAELLQRLEDLHR